MKVLVTSVDGLISRKLIKALQQNQIAISVMVRSSLTVLPESMTRVLSDIEDYEPTSEAISKCDFVIHLSMVSFEQYLPNAIGKGYEREILGTINVLNGCKTHKKPVVYMNILSCQEDVFGQLAAEAVERLFLMYRKEHGLRCAAIRCNTSYEPTDGEGAWPLLPISEEFTAGCVARTPEVDLVQRLLVDSRALEWDVPATLVPWSTGDDQQSLAAGPIRIVGERKETNTLSSPIYEVFV